ncbi:MAG: hypothetical protein GY791_13065 [Alphaproteobacteria bacterium]|nr:hypothetical protein [Alphaproteobacteria bacterium]
MRKYSPLFPVFAAVVLLGVSNGARAEDPELPVHHCAAAVGTYLATHYRTDGDEQEVASRALLALTNGGHVIRIDSGEAGEPGYSPFSDNLGRWRCLSKEGETPKLSGTFLNFTFPVGRPQQIARLDFTATYDAEIMVLEGRVGLSFVGLEEDPYDPAIEREETVFGLTAKKIVAP